LELFILIDLSFLRSAALKNLKGPGVNSGQVSPKEKGDHKWPPAASSEKNIPESYATSRDFRSGLIRLVAEPFWWRARQAGSVTFGAALPLDPSSECLLDPTCWDAAS